MRVTFNVLIMLVLTCRIPSAAAALAPTIAHPIDRLLAPYYAAHRIRSQPVVEDRVYARRIYLDLIGMLPTPAELRAFQQDGRSDKRARLAARLLSDTRRYTEHWLTFWNDLLRNDYTGTGYIDGGRQQITAWLSRALESNMPYDRFVSELVNPTPESRGFVKGIVWRGVVNASQTPEMQAAQNISQVFMGVNLKCASCHNSFINRWKLVDAYGLAGVYAHGPLEMVRCDQPTGQVAPIQFIYPGLGKIDSAAPREERMAQLAKILTSHSNRRLAKTLANRLWARLMGRGLVEPTDDMDQRPWHSALLEWLASDFSRNGYDVKKTLARIVTSHAYQLPSAGLKSERTSAFVFTGPIVKRMSAEQFVDAVSSLTGVWQTPANQLSIARGSPGLPPGRRAAIRYRSGRMTSGSARIDVPLDGGEVLILAVTDAGDGANHDWADWAEPRLEGSSGQGTRVGPRRLRRHPTPVGPHSETGSAGRRVWRLSDLKWRSATSGYGQVQVGKSVVEKPLRLGDQTFEEGIGTHATSVITYLLPSGATRFRAVIGPDAAAVEEPGARPSVEFFVITGERSLIEARAAMAVADPLMRALGRPNREQVVTQRSAVATTLQALELTNGQTVATMLAEGAEGWTKDETRSSAAIVDALYERALGRRPTAAERPVALQIVGTRARKEGIEDLLWALVMLPEFQLIY